MLLFGEAMDEPVLTLRGSYTSASYSRVPVECFA